MITDEQFERLCIADPWHFYHDFDEWLMWGYDLNERNSIMGRCGASRDIEYLRQSGEWHYAIEEWMLKRLPEDAAARSLPRDNAWSNAVVDAYIRWSALDPVTADVNGGDFANGLGDGSITIEIDGIKFTNWQTWRKE